MTQTVEVLADESYTGEKTTACPSAPQFRALCVGDYLYKEADPRTSVYRVEQGVVAVFERRIGRPAHIIEMAGKGDYVGLGCLEHHRDNVRAVVDSVVSVLPRHEFALLAESDPTLRQKQDDAIERDFEYGKALATDRGRSAPVECVAAFLVAVSRQNAHEGRDPTIVSDSLKCGVVTSLLEIDIGILARALLKLQGMGLVEQCPTAGLRLKDIGALERIADGDLQLKAALDGMPAGAAMESLSARARIGTSLRQMAAPSGPTTRDYWQGELREATWLVTVVCGLSITGVGLAVMFAMALL